MKLRFLTFLSLLANAVGLIALLATFRSEPAPAIATAPSVAVASSSPPPVEEPRQ